MNILLDMNMPEVWEEFLRAAGHTAIHWSRVGNIRALDEEIMEWARIQGQIVLTHDLDFGSLLFLTNASAPSVIQIRAEHPGRRFARGRRAGRIGGRKARRSDKMTVCRSVLAC